MDFQKGNILVIVLVLSVIVAASAIGLIYRQTQKVKNSEESTTKTQTNFPIGNSTIEQTDKQAAPSKNLTAQIISASYKQSLDFLNSDLKKLDSNFFLMGFSGEFGKTIEEARNFVKTKGSTTTYRFDVFSPKESLLYYYGYDSAGIHKYNSYSNQLVHVPRIKLPSVDLGQAVEKCMIRSNSESGKYYLNRFHYDLGKYTWVINFVEEKEAMKVAYINQVQVSFDCTVDIETGNLIDWSQSKPISVPQ